MVIGKAKILSSGPKDEPTIKIANASTPRHAGQDKPGCINHVNGALRVNETCGINADIGRMRNETLP